MRKSRGPVLSLSKGFAPILVIIVIVLVAAAFVGGGAFFGNKSKSADKEHQPPGSQETGYSDTSSGFGHEADRGDQRGGGRGAVFYNENGVVIEHYFPGENNLSSEESEMYVYNETPSEITFTKTSMDYLINGVAQGGKSGTWELFPNARSWDKIQYTNISEEYYDGTPLVVKPGQKAKIHYHYDVEGSSGSGESVKINLAFTQNGSNQTIDRKLER